MAEKDSLFVDKIYNTLQAKGVKSIGSYDEFVSKMKDNPDLFRDKVFNTLQAKGIKSTSNYDDFIANVNSAFEQKGEDYTDLSLNPDSVKSITQNIDNLPQVTLGSQTSTATPQVKLQGDSVSGYNWETQSTPSVIQQSVEETISKGNPQAQAKQIWENIGTSDAYSIENIKATVDDKTWNALVYLASEEKANHDNAIRNEVATRYYGTSAPETREREIQTQKALAQNPYEKEKFVSELQSQHSGRYVPAVTKEVENVKKRIDDLGYTTKTDYTNGLTPMPFTYREDKNGKRLSSLQSTYLDNANKLISDTEQVLNAPSRFDDSKGVVNFGKGIAERATDEEFWLPMLTIAKNMNIGAVAKKMNEGKELTPEESILLESYINYGLAQQARQYDMSKGYMAGQGTAESVMFMLEMAIGGKIASGAGKLLSSAGKKFANKFANKAIGKATGKVVNTLTKFATSENKLAQAGKAVAEAVIDPAFMASNYKNISQQYADEHVFGDGKFGVVDATSAWLDTSKEILTEKAGEGLSFIGAKGWNKIKATKYGKWIDSPMMKQLRNLYKGNGSMNLFMGMMQNPLSEIGEEYIGGIMDFVRSYNPLLDDDRKKELREGATSMFTAEGLGDTALMVAPLSFIFGGVSFVRGANATRNFSKAKDKLTEELFRQGLNEEQVAQIILKLDSTDDIEERKKIFAQLSDAILQQWGDRNPSTTQEEKQLFENKIHSTLEYYLMSSQAFNNMVAKITDNYNELKEDERKSVDKAFETYTEEFFKRKQEEAKARNEERKATEMAEEQVAEQLFEETVQEAEEVVPGEDAPQTEIYDEKKGYYITKEGDNISITSQDGQLLKLSNKSEANSIVKNLNENFEGEVEFEVVKDSSGVSPKFSIVSKPKTQEVVTAEVTEGNAENSEGKVTESVENVGETQGEDVETDGNSEEIERNKEEIEEEKAERIAEEMLQQAIEETNNVTGTEDVKQPTIVYYRGKQHELLSPTTEDGSIIIEDNLVRIKEVGKDKTKAVRPENVYNDANYSEVAKTYPPKTNTDKNRKINPQDYKNTDVNANDVADAFLREYGVDDTIEALQEMYSEALEKTQSAKGLAKAEAKKELRRLEEVANAISEKTNVVVNLQNNTVEEVIEETEEVAEEPQMGVSEVVTDSDPVEVTETETAEEVPTNEDSTNETPTTEETGVVEQEPTIETEVTEQTATSVEEKDAIKDPDEVKETPVEVKKEKTKKNPRGAGRKSNQQKRQEALENAEGKDLSSNINNTIEENSGLGMVDFLMTEIGNMPDVVKDIAEPMLDDFDENTSYEEAYKLFTNVENELIKQGVNATKFHDLAEMYIYRPCEVTDEAIQEKYPLLEQTQTQQEENTKVIEEEDVEEVGEESIKYTQEYIDSIPLEEFTYYKRFYNRDKKNGVLEKSIAIIKPLDDRYYAAVFTIKGQKVRSIIDGDKIEMSPEEGIIVYPKGEDDKPNFNKPYLAMMNSEELDKGLTTRDTVNLKSLFDGEGDSKRSQFAATLFLSNGNRLVKTDSEIKEEKKNNAVKNFEKIEGSNETKFKTKVAQYLDIIEDGLKINENLHADLLSKLNEFIGRINTLAEGVGFIKIKPLKTGSSRAELESYIKAIRNFIENPTGDVSTIVNDIVSRHNLSNITESEEFSDIVKNQASLSPALKKKVKAEVSELKEQEKDIVAQITEKNRKGSLSAVERIELKKLKDKKAEISKERKEKEASLEGNFNKVIDYVNEQINRVNAEFKLFGITPIKKIESTKANPIKDIKELKGVLDEALSAERKVEATTKEYDSKEEAIKQLMKEYEVDEATANDIYNLREKNGTLEVRKAIPSAIADVYANEYWYSGARKRFEQSLDVLFAGGVRVVSQDAIDKILNLHKPIAITQKNVDILKQWIGGVDIEVVKPNHKDRALYDGAFGWYDLANKKVVVVEGAPISVVLHEVGWHATLDWAKTNDTKMYEKMLQIASEAPADIRFDIVSKYGELSEEAFLDELGAEMFTRAAQKKLYEYITTQEARRWWQKMFDAFDKLFKKARLKIFRQPIKSKKIDFEAMEKMNSVDFLNNLADTMIKGEVLGKWTKEDKEEARNKKYQDDIGYYLYDSQRRYNKGDLYNSGKSSNFVEEYKFNKEQYDLRQRGQLLVSKRFTPEERKGFEKGNRILENATYLVGGSQSTSGEIKEQDPFEREEQRRETQEQILEDWAKANNLWIDNTESQLSEEYEYLTEGGEADVYLDTKNNKVIKAIGLDYYVSPQLALDRIVLHNYLFGDETPLNIKGFGRNSGGYFKIIVEQPYIKGESLSYDEIEQYIENLGFPVKNRGNWTYANEDIYISDLHDENVILTPEGNIAVIDADIRINTPELKYGGIRETEIDKQDNNIRYMSSGSNIYGVQQGDELFVNITPEQKIGECADLWLEQLRQSNPRAYELIFGEGENPNLMSDLMAIVRDKLKGLVDAEEIDLSDEVLREMTFEEFMTFADALENLNMQNVSKSITRVQESMEKFEAMLSAESPTSGKVKEAIERWWAAAMDDGLPITRMLQGLNAYLIKEGLPKLDSRYDIANLRNLAQSKSKFFIEKFRDRGEFADFVEQAKALDAVIANNEALKDLADKLALDRVNSDKEALQSLVEVYMLAKDNVERRNMDLPCTSNDAWLENTGMADVEFVEIFEAEFTTKQLADFWRAKNKATNVSLDFLLDYGILSQAQYDRFKERQYYVPQRGFDNLELEEDNNIPSNTSVPNPKSVQALYKAGGRDTMATSPIAQILLITDNAIRTSLNNEYRKAMLDLVRKYPAYFIDKETGKSMVSYGSAWKEVTFDENGNKKTDYVAFRDEELVKEDKDAEHNISVMEEKIKELNMEMGKEKRKKNPDTDLIKSLEEEVKKLKEGIVYANDHMHYRRVYDEKKGEEAKAHQVFVKDNGGEYVLTFDDKRIANALNNLHFDQAGAVGFIKKMNRYTSNIYTTYNPAFGFKNLARDIMQIILNGCSQYGLKFLGHASKNVLTCLPKGIFNIASYLNKSNIKFDEDFEEFLSSGAMTGYVYSMSLEDYRNNVKSILQGDYYEGGELTKKGWEKMKDTLKFITEFSELYVRYVAFRTGRDLGYSQHQSAVMAKNLGVNFDKRGSGFGKGSGYKIGKPTGNDNSVIWQLIDVVNNNMSFSRASMRGMASLYEPLFLGDKKTRKNTRWMLGGIAIFGVFEGLLYAFSSDDDEDKDRLIREKVGSWDRHSNTMWWVDDTTWYGKIGKNFGSITQNFIPFYTFGFELVRMIDNMYFNKVYKMSLDDAALNFGYNMYSEITNYAIPLPPTITEFFKTSIDAAVTLDGEKAKMLIPIITPTAAKPITEFGLNVDYLGNKVYYPMRTNKVDSEYSNFNYGFLWEDEYGRKNKYILKDGDIKEYVNPELGVIFVNHFLESYLPKPIVDAKDLALDKISEANGVIIEKPENKDAKYDLQVRRDSYRYIRDLVQMFEGVVTDSKSGAKNLDVDREYIINELAKLHGTEIANIYIDAKIAQETYETTDVDKFKKEHFGKKYNRVSDEEMQNTSGLNPEYMRNNQDIAVDMCKDIYIRLLQYKGDYEALTKQAKKNVIHQ